MAVKDARGKRLLAITAGFPTVFGSYYYSKKGYIKGIWSVQGGLQKATQT